MRERRGGGERNNNEGIVKYRKKAQESSIAKIKESYHFFRRGRGLGGPKAAVYL